MSYKILLGALLAASSYAAANAATIYTSRAAFMAATTGQVTEDFEENASGTTTFYAGTYSGSTFSIVGGPRMYTVDPDYDPLYQWNSGDVLDFETFNGTITVSPGITALGFDFGNPTGFQGAGFVTINGVNYTLLGQPTFNFWGIVDTNPIGTINWNDGLGIMDNVTTGFAGVVVPEPSTWAVLLLGFGAVGAGMRRRKVSLSYA